MKTSKTMSVASFALTMFMTLSGCSKDVLDFRNASFSNGLIYSAESNTPYSGNLTNFPLSRNESVKSGLSTFLSNMGAKTKYAAEQDACDFAVKNGILNGKAICKTSSTPTVRTEFSLVDGLLDGPIKFYDPTGNKVLAKAYYSKGLLDGRFESFNESGAPQLVGDYKNGLRNGINLAYGPDGSRVIYRGTFVQDKPDGVVEQYWIENGVLAYHIEYLNGVLHGIYRQFDLNGKLVREMQYDHGNPVRDSLGYIKDQTLATKGSSLEQCTDNFVANYRAEMGADAIVTQDQISEWNERCSRGENL